MTNRRIILRASGLFAAAALVLVSAHSCGTSSKLRRISKGKLAAQLVTPQESDIPELAVRKRMSDTLKVKDDITGKDLFLMKAIRDDETGESVATEMLQAAVVTARSRHTAERRGKVDLKFQVIVPQAMQDSKWRLRFFPVLHVLGDSIALDPVIITGKDYRKAQLRGYQQYEKFLSTIITDTTKFININQLEIFLERNLPEIFAFKNDSTYVSDEQFASVFGVTERQAVDHYTDHFRKNLNARRYARREKMFRKYVKSPIVTEGIRLDTVVRQFDGDFVYNYVQTINTRPKLKRAEVFLSGDIFEADRRIYTIPRSEPLVFYISSISAFVDQTDRYLTRVIERRAEANASYRIAFAIGKSDVQPDLAENRAQIGYVQDNLADLLRNEVFDLDSIVVVANASPDGTWSSNGSLSARRGEAVKEYFQRYISEYRRDYLSDAEYSVDEHGNMTAVRKNIPSIRFISHSVPENWALLDRLVREDTFLNEAQKERYFSRDGMKDKDAREAAMRTDDYYRYLKDTLYPRLRVVDFAFHLHRKGMVKDTVHTTELDERYMQGVQRLKDMDYEEAVKILGPYQDYNAAVAYVGADRNASAMLILQNLPKTAQVNYMLAIVHSRNGNIQEAVQCYLDACRQEPSYVHRGGLDPEISVLIKMYGLNKLGDDEFVQ